MKSEEGYTMVQMHIQLWYCRACDQAGAVFSVEGESTLSIARKVTAHHNLTANPHCSEKTLKIVSDNNQVPDIFSGFLTEKSVTLFDFENEDNDGK